MKCFEQSCLTLKIELNIPQRTPPVNRALHSPQCDGQTFCRVVKLEGGGGVGRRWRALFLFDNRISLQGTNRTITINNIVSHEEMENSNLKTGIKKVLECDAQNRTRLPKPPKTEPASKVGVY